MSQKSIKITFYIGRSGSGKTYAAKQNAKKDRGVVLSFADALREELGVDKMIPEAYLVWKENVGRKLMQEHADKMKEYFSKIYYADKLFSRIIETSIKKKKNTFHIDDLRYLTELEHIISRARLGYFYSNGFHFTVNLNFIFCDYKQGDYPEPTHNSEFMADEITKFKDFRHLEELKVSKTYNGFEFFSYNHYQNV